MMSYAKHSCTVTRQLPLLLCLLLLTGPGAVASQPPFAPQVAVGERQLELLGNGVLRFGLLVDVYAAALYGDSGTEVLADDRVKRLDLHYYRSIERAQIIAAAEKVLRKQLGEEAFNKLRPALGDWHEALRGVEPGDRYVMEYDGTEIRLSLNGSLVARSQDRRLAAAYFGIWLDERPISSRLRQQLLSAENT